MKNECTMHRPMTAKGSFNCGCQASETDKETITLCGTDWEALSQKARCRTRFQRISLFCGGALGAVWNGGSYERLYSLMNRKMNRQPTRLQYCICRACVSEDIRRGQGSSPIPLTTMTRSMWHHYVTHQPHHSHNANTYSTRSVDTVSNSWLG